MTREHIPGMSVLVMRGDSVLLSRGYGYANLELAVPASDSTVYQSGSIGKQFTAALVLMLVEKGTLRLDDPIVRFLPEGKRRWRGVTIRHLLNHTSGIPDYTDGTVDLHREYSEDQLVRLAAGLPLAFAPGERWSYSNTGYLLLGALIHRATGSFYGDLLAKWLFQPLGMPSARIISEADIVPNRAAGYQRVRGTLANQDWVSPSLNTTADGSLYLSLRDYERWTVALNHRRLPSGAVLDMAWTPARLDGGRVYPYGTGWILLPQRAFVNIGHTGSWQGFQTSIQRYPQFDLSVVVLSNLGGSHPGPISQAIAGIVEPKLAAPHTLPADSAPGPVETRVEAALRATRSGEHSIHRGQHRRSAASPRAHGGRNWPRRRRACPRGNRWVATRCRWDCSCIWTARSLVRVTSAAPERPTSLLASVYLSADERIAGVETYQLLIPGRGRMASESSWFPTGTAAFDVRGIARRVRRSRCRPAGRSAAEIRRLCRAGARGVHRARGSGGDREGRQGGAREGIRGPAAGRSDAGRCRDTLRHRVEHQAVHGHGARRCWWRRGSSSGTRR